MKVAIGTVNKTKASHLFAHAQDGWWVNSLKWTPNKKTKILLDPFALLHGWSESFEEVCDWHLLIIKEILTFKLWKICIYLILPFYSVEVYVPKGIHQPLVLSDHPSDKA